MQVYLKSVLESFLHPQPSVRMAALHVVNLILRQGLVHPVQVGSIACQLKQRLWRVRKCIRVGLHSHTCLDTPMCVQPSLVGHSRRHPYIFGPVYTALEELENGGFTVKTHQIFSLHTTPEEFKNATITGHFGFVFEENSVRDIAC